MRIHTPIGNDQQRITGAHRLRSALAELFQAVPQAGFAFCRAEQRRQRRGEEIARETRRSFSRSLLVRIGCGSLSVWQFSGVSSRMLRSVPM